jgi:S1-C subfamily serine protease
MLRQRILPAAIIGLTGAIIGSFLMMLYASTHFVAVTGPPHDPPAAAAAPLSNSGSDQERIISAVKRVKPSVVAIDVSVNGRQYIPVDPIMQQFYGQQGPGVLQPYSAKDSGSGFIYGSQGYIVTNAHVVRPIPGAQTTTITIVFPNGEKSPAKLVAANVGADLALLKVTDGHRLPASLTLADSDKLEQGQWAIAIGEPYELQQSVTVGVVSAFERSEPIQTESGQSITFKGLLQTSAPINFGNSGGPLIDMNGNVIGVNQSTLGGRAQGIGFAIPSNMVKRVVDQMIAHPGITQPPAEAFMGVELQSVSSGFRNQTNYKGQGGVAVIQVISGSPADSAGIQPGDVILKLNGKDYSDGAALSTAIGKLRPGDHVSVEVWSQGSKRLAQVTLGAKPDLGQQGDQQQPDQQQP